MPEHKTIWLLDYSNGATTQDAAVVPVVAAMVVADKDNVGISLTTIQDAVVVATPLPRNEEVTPRTTGIFTGAEPTNFAVPQPSFGRSC